MHCPKSKGEFPNSLFLLFFDVVQLSEKPLNFARASRPSAAGQRVKYIWERLQQWCTRCINTVYLCNAFPCITPIYQRWVFTRYCGSRVFYLHGRHKYLCIGLSVINGQVYFIPIMRFILLADSLINPPYVCQAPLPTTHILIYTYLHISTYHMFNLSTTSRSLLVFLKGSVQPNLRWDLIVNHLKALFNSLKGQEHEIFNLWFLFINL